MSSTTTAPGPARRARALVAVLAATTAAVLLPTAPAGARPTPTAAAGPATTAVAPSPSAVTAEPLGDGAAAQIEAIVEDKAGRTPAERKVDSNLLYALAEADDGVAVAGAPKLSSSVEVPADGDLVVDIDATVGPGLLGAIEAVGGRVVAAVPDLRAVRAEVPLDAVVDLAARAEVTGVRPADLATTSREAGPAPEGAATAAQGNGANEAELTHQVAAARTTYGATGSGIKVCVLSDGVDSLVASQSSGDLPAVAVLPGQSGSGDEGTAMLELIHDLVPDATLGFATAFNGVASFAQNIINLQTSGCRVIVDDVGYFVEANSQDGPIAQAITTVRAAGATYFTSSSNSGNLADGTSGTWQGDFQDAGASGGILPAGNLHGWGNGVGYNTITKAGSGPIDLQWADPLGASANDYDLYVLNSTGTSVVASSTNVQAGSGAPWEEVARTYNVVNNRIVVLKKASAANRFLAVYSNRGQLSRATGGSARGHNASVDAISVGATPASNAIGSGQPVGPYPNPHSAANVSELFSSDGPVRRFYSANGTAITPGDLSSTGGVLSNGVDITAADGATTTVPGFLRFFGTSAAAPNAAAIAAQALSAKPTLTPAAIEAAMKATAIDIEAAGIDTTTGTGVVMAPALLANVGASPRATVTAASAATFGVVGGDSDTAYEPGETVQVAQALRNVGPVGATAVSATLTSTTADATIVNGTTTYADLAGGASGSATGAPLRFKVSPTCQCGKVLRFTLTVTYSGGATPTATIPLSLVTGAPGAPSAIAYAGAASAIPDNSTTGSTTTVTVGNLGLVTDLTFTIGGTACTTAGGSTTVGITHSYTGDLTATLTSPTGTVVTLFSGVGAGSSNFCQTVLSDAGTSPIQSATTAPFTGTFRPASPLAAFDGESAQGTWTLKVVDGFATDTGTVRAWSLGISPASCSTNLAPTAAADAYPVVKNTAKVVAAPGVLANDSDPEGDALTASVVAAPGHGSVSLAADGSFTYTPTTGYTGTDTFTYAAADPAHGATSVPATVTLTVTAPVAPTAVADSYQTKRATALNVAAPGVLANDTPAGAKTAVLGTGPAHGTLSLAADGSFAYTPTAGYSGVDTFTYQASNGSASAPATVSIRVNDPPTAVADSYAATASTPLTVAAPGVLANDTDVEGDARTATLVATVAHGTLSLGANGSFTYTPTSGYVGSDAFTYRAVDAYGTSAIATVSLTVSSVVVDQAPTAAADSYRVVSDHVLTRTAPGVLANDTDPEGHALTAVVGTGPAHGGLVLGAAGSFTYTPTAGYSGPDSFTYRANDGTSDSAPATVSILVVTPLGAYVDAVYGDFLDRVADAGGMAFWGGRLTSGKDTRTSFVRQMSRSPEYARKIVRRAFQDVLGRDTDPSGLTYWSGKVTKGMPISTLVLQLMGSNEFLTKTGGTLPGFVDAAFQAILGRQPSTAERNARLAQLSAGTTRGTIASDLYRSSESRRRRTMVQFQLLLGRAPTSAEYATWTANLATQSDTSLAIALGASDEYYANAQEL